MLENRRDARRIAGALGAVGVLLGATFSTAAQARFAGGAAAKPAYGGTISVRDAGAPDCLDPQKTALSASNLIDQVLFDGLVSIDARGRVVPDLALTYKATNGGKTVTFSLRHGVRFSNGDPFDARAVKFTFDRALNPATKSPATASNLAQVQSTKVVNTYTVQLTMKTPYRPLLTQLAIAYEGILDPKATQQEGAGTCQNPIGTGPFKIANVGAGFNTVTVVRNNNHTFNPPWMANRGKAYLSKIVFKAITSDATAVSELLSGGLDYSDIAGTQLSRVKGNKTIVLHNVKGQGETFLGFNFARPPFNNPQVRKAVAEVIDRKAIVTAALDGLGAPVYSPLPPTIPYFDKNATKYMPKLNPSDAQRIFTANHVTGPYDLLTFQSPAVQTAAELIQAELGQAGVRVNVVTKAIADYIPTAAKGDFDMNLLSWGYPDPDFLYSLFHSSQGKGAGLNFTNYTNATLDNALVQGRESLNQKAAAKAYNTVQELMNKDIVIVPLVVSIGPVGLRSRVKGYHLNRQNAFPYQDLYVSGK